MDRCDRCGRGIAGGEARYLLRIEVMAAADPLEIDEPALRRDLAAEMTAIERELERVGAEEAEDGVYRQFRFEQCLPCQVEYLRDPLPGAGCEARSRQA